MPVAELGTVNRSLIAEVQSLNLWVGTDQFLFVVTQIVERRLMLRLMTPPLALWLDVQRQTRQMSHLWHLTFSQCVLEYNSDIWRGYIPISRRPLAESPFLPSWLA